MNYVTKHKPSLTKRLRSATKALFSRYYEGASFSKDNRSWNLITRTSANVENRIAGQIMANRARSLLRDSPYAHRALQTIVHNTVGAGIVPQIRCDDESITKDLSDLWHEWAGSTAIDIEGRQDFYSLQAQVLRTIVSDGESLVRVVNSKNSSRIPYQLQVLEPDYLDTYKEYRTETGYISSGIEFKKVSDTRFDRSAYWLFKEHPGGFLNLQSYQSFSGVSIPVPASEILHVYRVDRPGAIRGVSWFHPCIMSLSDLHDYQQAVLRHQKLTACFAVFIRNLNGDAVLSDEEELSDIQPGMVYRLGPGEDISIVQPPEPATNYGEYCNHHLKSIASAMGITFECLSSDLSNVNFSSGRMGWIEMFRNIDSWQSQMLIPLLCEPVWKLFIKTAQIYGIDTDGVGVNWVPPKREMINPTDEVEALKTEVRSGFVTYSEALRSLGKDPEPHMQEAARDFERLKKLGLKLECDPANEIQKQQPQSQLKLLKEPMNAKT